MTINLITTSHVVFIIFCFAVIADQVIILRSSIKKITELESLEVLGFPKDPELKEQRERIGQALMSMIVAIVAGFFLTQKLFS